jgi:hypothetical protein
VYTSGYTEIITCNGEDNTLASIPGLYNTNIQSTIPVCEHYHHYLKWYGKWSIPRFDPEYPNYPQHPYDVRQALGRLRRRARRKAKKGKAKKNG